MVIDLAIHSIGELIFIVFFIVSVMISLYAFYSFLSQTAYAGEKGRVFRGRGVKVVATVNQNYPSLRED